jgi:IstB-like ATP binding protein
VNTGRVSGFVVETITAETLGFACSSNRAAQDFENKHHAIEGHAMNQEVSTIVPPNHQLLASVSSPMKRRRWIWLLIFLICVLLAALVIHHHGKMKAAGGSEAVSGTVAVRPATAQAGDIAIYLDAIGTGKTHIVLALGLSACQRGHRVRFTTAAALVSELIEARDDKHLLRFQKLLASYKLLIVDELGYVPLSKSGAELLFETFSQRYERASTLVTSNLPFEEWTEVFGSERLTGALLDRITHHVHILEMNGDSYRLKQSRRKRNPLTDL